MALGVDWKDDIMQAVDVNSAIVAKGKTMVMAEAVLWKTTVLLQVKDNPNKGPRGSA